MHDYEVLDIAFDPLGRYAATVDKISNVGLWDLATGAPIIFPMDVPKYWSPSIDIAGSQVVVCGPTFFTFDLRRFTTDLEISADDLLSLSEAASGRTIRSGSIRPVPQKQRQQLWQSVGSSGE